MKKSFRTVLAGIFLASSLFILAGCEKYFDYYPHGQHGKAGKNEIRMVIVKPPYVEYTDTIRFNYNEYDNPVIGLRSEIRTGAPNYFFKYDRFQRLTELIAAYGLTATGSGVETWTEYFYDAKGRIVKDSVWSFPEVVNGHPVKSLLSTVTISFYEYDSKDRIEKVTWLREGVEPYITQYSYDSKGNKVGASYDNKLNYHATNKVWMFLARDYSVNNPLIGSYTYNKAGLPLTIDCGESFADFLIIPFSPVSFTKATIAYNK